MPYWNILRIVPVALLAAPAGTDPNPLGVWQLETADTLDPDGLGATTAVYDISEATPRSTITHRLGNAAPTAAQLALVNGWGTDVNGDALVPANCAGTLCRVWDRSLGASTNPGAAMLASAGLTTSIN